ncbi:MAG TPA: ferrochelatase [Chloroflexota bacterium]
MTESKTLGVLLMAYGTPDTLENVEPYYTHIRRGRTPAPELVEELRERYRLVGGTTPLLRITEETRKGLERQLNQHGDRRFRVFLGMKHWHPYIEQAVREMDKAGVQRAVGLVLAPHYSRMSVAGYYEYFDQAQQKLGTSIALERVESWHLHRPYLEAVARRVRAQLEQFPAREDVTVIFTAHSLPERILKDADPYPEQLRETSEALAEMLALRHWTFSYQSAGRTADPWLGPDLVDKVNELADAGVNQILVASIGFVSDHLEILYDIDYEAQEAAKQRGVTLRRTDMLNASPDFVKGLADLVWSRLAASAE